MTPQVNDKGYEENQENRFFSHQKEIIKAGNFKIGLTHGEGAPEGIIDTVKKQFEKDKVDCIVFGHSHAPICERRENILFFNPGSPTDTIFAPFNSYGILEVDKKIEGTPKKIIIEKKAFTFKRKDNKDAITG